MMNYIWAGLMLLAIVFGIGTGRSGDVSAAVMSGGQDAIELILSLAGIMCFWNGLMKVAEEAGITRLISRLLSPLTRRLLGGVDPAGAAGQAISMNMTANLLGMGNAATPLGLHAMRELQKENPDPTRATRRMVLFVVLNTASIQLIPTTVAIIRGKHGAAAPMDILPAVWVASVVSLTIGLTVARLLCGRDGRKTPAPAVKRPRAVTPRRRAAFIGRGKAS